MPEDSSKRSFAESVALAALVGLILRLWYVLVIHPPANFLVGVPLDFVNRAYVLLDPHQPNRWAGLWSGLVATCALTVQTIGNSVEHLSPVQAVLSAATPPLAAFAFRRSRFAAALTWVLALDPFAIANAALFLPNAYVGFFLALTLALLSSDRPRAWFWAGAALALAVWFQPWTGLWPEYSPGWHAVYLGVGLWAMVRFLEFLAALPPGLGLDRVGPIATIVGASLVTTAPLWLGYWYGSHEWDRYLARLVEYVRDWRDWHLFPRWCPDCYGGYGSPLFDFHPPVVFAPAAVFVLLGANVTTAYKLTMVLAAFLGSIGTYLLVRDETGRRDAAVVGAMAFSFAPYQFMNLLLRGDLSEVMAIAFFPITFWLYRSLLRAPLQRLPWIAFWTMICHAAIVLSHTITGQWTTEILAISLLPAAVGLIRRGDYRRLSVGFLTLTASMGLSAIYVIPALIEKKLVYLERITTGYFTATQHLVPAWRFLRFWFYDFVEDGYVKDSGRMPFFVGFPIVLGLVLAGWLLLRKRTRPAFWTTLPWWLGFAALLWIMTPQSTPVWKILPLAGFIEFPWRLLGSASVLGAAALGLTWAAAVPPDFPNRVRYAVAAIGFFVLVAVPMVRVAEYIGPAGIRLTEADVRGPVDAGMTSAEEHLPRVVPDVPKGPRKELWTKATGDVEGSVAQAGGTDYDVHLYVRQAPADVDLAVVWFVGWKVRTRSGPAPLELSASPKGRIRLHAAVPGNYEVHVYFDGTPARTAGLAVSLFFLFLLYPTLRLLVRTRPARLRQPAQPREPAEPQGAVAAP